MLKAIGDWYFEYGWCVATALALVYGYYARGVKMVVLGALFFALLGGVMLFSATGQGG